MQRAMFLEFPDDPTTQWLDRQYMLGPSLLVAPVFVPVEEESIYYIPKGRWTYYWDQTRTILGPLWVREVVPSRRDTAVDSSRYYSSYRSQGNWSARLQLHTRY